MLIECNYKWNTNCAGPAMNSASYVLKSNLPGDKRLFKQFARERFNSSHNLYRKDLVSHYACVNSISFSRNGEMFVSGGDDKRVLLWDTSEMCKRKCAKPIIMKREHYSNIFSAIFDCTDKFIFSAGNDQQVLQHNIERQEPVGFYFFDDSIYSVDSPADNPHLFVASGEDGTVQIVDTRSQLERTKLASSGGSYHSAVFHPIESQLIATANSIFGISLWDIRRPLKVLKKFSSGKHKSGMSVRFDGTGRTLLALYRKGAPVLYEVLSDDLVASFAHPKFRNYCTMKSACFAGDKDQFVVSGSDDFNIYVWKIPESTKLQEDPHLILQGHRSIVNQIRYDQNHNLLASSGVEKCIKLWSCFPLRDSEGDIANEETFNQRTRYTHEQYIRMTAAAAIDETGGGQGLMHSNGDKSTEEDPRMIALFDSLIERTQNDWASDTDTDSDGEGTGLGSTRMQRIIRLLFDNELSSSSTVSPSEDENGGGGGGGGGGSGQDNQRSSSQTVGVSIDELRRIFRRNSEILETEVDEEQSDERDSIHTTSSTTNTNNLLLSNNIEGKRSGETEQSTTYGRNVGVVVSAPLLDIESSQREDEQANNSNLYSNTVYTGAQTLSTGNAVESANASSDNILTIDNSSMSQQTTHRVNDTLRLTETASVNLEDLSTTNRPIIETNTHKSCCSRNSNASWNQPPLKEGVERKRSYSVGNKNVFASSDDDSDDESRKTSVKSNITFKKANRRDNSKRNYRKR